MEPRFFLDSDDPVTLTLAFENGTVTSTFEDGGEDSGTGTGDQYDYIIVDQNRFSITETPQLGSADYITFDQVHRGRGKLFDFKSDGQIDESGTWEFSFQSSDLAVRPRSIRASRDLVYLQTPSGPNEIEGAGEIDFELELFDQPNITSLSLTIDGQNYSLSSDQKPNGFSLEYGYKDQSKPKELFDLESASDSDWSSYKSGKNFEFSLTIGENYYNYTHILPGEAELPTPPSPSISGGGLWKIDQAGYDYLEVDVAGSYIISWAEFDTTDQNDFIQVSLVELVEGDEQSIFEKIILSPTATSYEIAGDLLDLDKQYIIYIEFLNVVQSENPDGFVHATGSDVSQSLLLTSAKSFSALSFILIDPVIETVVSGPDGRPVVMRMGDEYQWNDTLDGVMLWGVWQDDDTNDWVIATVNYIGGRQKGAKGSYSSLPAELDVDHPYTINGDTIDVTETNGHQYYQITSVDNDTIYAVDGDGIPLTDPSWWFVTKSAAEEFYNSKIALRPVLPRGQDDSQSQRKAMISRLCLGVGTTVKMRLSIMCHNRYILGTRTSWKVTTFSYVANIHPSYSNPDTLARE